MEHSARSSAPSTLWLGVILPLLALVILIGLGLLVAAYPALPAWDAAFLLHLHRYATPELNQGVAIATKLGTKWGVLPASLGLIALGLWHRNWQPASYLALVMAGSAELNQVAKVLWHRVRPALWEGIPPHTDFSFPSGHATYSMTFVLALILLNWDSPKRPWLLGLGGLFVLCIGASRVYLGVHFPSDILGGWLLAAAWALSLHQAMFRWLPLLPELLTKASGRPVQNR
ncbi:phosphatase PAP2 family protein [Nodosilinea sp. FACHB-13]|uniref:phosphatase PAP2 family protein n=1 Tax=Cyanophyceae TaxID=3028117 RepID=UPI001681D843|nr:phosphatase PAP2 family protein [Nodosilinea sp. FACHB-13]MBD2108309.1 phosphatase PAP2 family protein [Nodosilinea sp. FACHB-13]